MRIVTIHSSQENTVRLMQTEDGKELFDMSEEEIVELIHKDMVRNVNDRGCEEEEMHTIEDLEANNWYITDDSESGNRVLALYSGNPADDPECDVRIYNIIEPGMGNSRPDNSEEKLISQILAVRDSGLTNMFDIMNVRQIALAMGFPQLAAYLEEHREEYSHFILTGKFEGSGR